MMKSKTSIPTTFKMAAIYVFALSTAVACGKFQAGTNTKGTNNGTATVVREGTPGAVADGNITIDKVETVLNGVTDFDNYSWSLKISVTHGGRAIEFVTWPSVHPFNEDGVQKDIAPMHYVAKGVCGDDTCSKFAVLIDVTDTSNGTTYQSVQYWDKQLNNSAPQRSFPNTQYENATAVYESLSGLELPID